MNINLETLTVDCPLCSPDYLERNCALCGGRGYLPIAHGLRRYSVLLNDAQTQLLTSATAACQSEMVYYARTCAEKRNKQRAAVGGAK